jgi:hypothetical protein
MVDVEIDRCWFVINHAGESEFDYILSQLGYHSSERETIDNIVVKVDTDYNETM